MSSDSIQLEQQMHHHNQQLHNHYGCDYQNGIMQEADHVHIHPSEYHHEEQMDSQSSMLSDAIIRGNMQYVNGELRKIPRPLNAFMIFSNEKRKELKREFPGEPNNMISSRLGAAWKGLSDELRKKYHEMAHREDLEHRRKYPNYQYCPGHARKLKKARREQRLRQQGMYRSRQPPKGTNSSQGAANTRKKGEVGRPKGSTSAHKKDAIRGIIKKERAAKSHTDAPSTSSNKRASVNQIVHGVPVNVTTSSSAVSGTFGEGSYTSAAGFVSPAEATPDCVLSGFEGCKPTEVYCCPENHWSTTDHIATAHGFAPVTYPPPMFYFSPSYEAQFTSDTMMPQPCLMSGDCNGCYSSVGYIDGGCYGPLYPAVGTNVGSGDAGLMYKDMCFVPSDSPMSTSPTQVTAVGSVMVPREERGQSELTDISNNMVASSSQDSQESSNRSCTSKESYSLSPSTLEEVSSSSELAEVCDN